VPQSTTPPGHTLVIAFVSLSSFIISSDFSLLSVALPSIGRGLNASTSVLSLIAATGALVFASFMVLGGRLADLFGQVRCCNIGLALYASGALVAALAPGIPMLIVGRAVQGLGCAILSPASFSMLNTALPAGAIRNRGYGAYASTQGAAVIVGSALGGSVTTLFGWRAAFLLNIPVAIVSIVLGLRAFPRAPLPAGRRSVDVGGALLVAMGTALIVWSLSIMGQRGLLSIEGIGAGAGGVAAFVAFFWLEKSLAAPLVPLLVFRSHNVVSSCVAMICVMASCAAIFILPNVYMQRILGLSAAQSGFGMIPQAIAAMLMGRLLTVTLGRYTLRTNILLGTAALLSGLLLFPASWALFPASGYSVAILPPLVLAAFSSLLPIMALMAGITMAVPANLQGVASAVAMTCQQIGLTLGITLVLTVTGYGQLRGEPLGASLSHAFFAAAAVAALGAVCILLLTKRYERGEAVSVLT
jgi:DHA2 family methylenomycin A resistance protein-like MFS transporter